MSEMPDKIWVGSDGWSELKDNGFDKAEYTRSDLTTELADALEDILDYKGGATNALLDPYVMERARESLKKLGR